MCVEHGHTPHTHHTHTCTHAHTHAHSHTHTYLPIDLHTHLCFLKAWKALSVGKFFLLSVSALNMTPTEVSLGARDTLSYTGEGVWLTHRHAQGADTVSFTGCGTPHHKLVVLH